MCTKAFIVDDAESQSVQLNAFALSEIGPLLLPAKFNGWVSAPLIASPERTDAVLDGSADLNSRRNRDGLRASISHDYRDGWRCQHGQHSGDRDSWWCRIHGRTGIADGQQATQSH